MRKVIVGAMVSLDGVMQAPGGPQEDPKGGFGHGGWVAPLADEVFGGEIGRMFDQEFDLLLGRKTYEIFAAHWPYAEHGPAKGVKSCLLPVDQTDDYFVRRQNERPDTRPAWALPEPGRHVGAR